MAKKKKRKPHRHPVAPPVHSAPEAVHAPPTRAAEPFSARPSSPEPPVTGEPLHDAPAFERETAPSRPRTPQSRRRPPARRRRRNGSRYVIAVLVLVAIVAAVAGRQVLNSRRGSSFNKIALAAGCAKVQTIKGLTNKHVQSATISYKTSPPTGGNHDPVPLGAGTYPAAFSTDPTKQPSIYQAVHSLEHGYVIVWYKGLSTTELDAMTKAVSGESKVILVPYPDMPGTSKVALTSWGRLEYCGKPSTRVATSFIKRFKNSPTAPEYYNQ
jgi:type II secretory pathway pseudopilin PulG